MEEQTTDIWAGPGRFWSGPGAVLERSWSGPGDSESPQSLDKLPPLILLAFDPGGEAGSLQISGALRSGSNVFPIESRSGCERLHERFEVVIQGKPKAGGTGISFPKASSGAGGHL